MLRKPKSIAARAGKRKSLARTLGNLFKLPLQLLPFYARITATLSQHFPDIGATVAAAALSAFRSAAKNKAAAARALEPRIRAARYLCELAKFRIVGPGALALSASCRYM